MKNDIVKTCLNRKKDLEKYDYIMRGVLSCDLSQNSDNEKALKTKFKGFYRVRRNQQWCDIYFKFLEENKCNKDITFDTIIQHIYDNTGNRVEASFASKMLATINDSKPILDSKVLENMGLKLSYSQNKEYKLQRAKYIYSLIDKRYTDYCQTENSDKAVELFNEIFPEYSHFSKTKKVDFFLWMLETPQLKELGYFDDLLY